ncbi:ring finger domain containing protein [Niveomyces insectorum RCEF 264]|uniref:Ring finger domain containing protein n=1 Tax=Niveomyces insectorum RCEF 264 TaxID=1081102 RepID=A0A162L2N7_9HYPO|nr:ring finger domain containing protein [Niveomyces insectorum RCEF 264]
MSLPPSTLGKSLSSPPPSSHSPVASAPASTTGADHCNNRRPNQQTSASATGSAAAPRKNQASRKQHRNQRRPAAGSGSGSGTGAGGGGRGDVYNYGRPDDEDAMAELRALRNASSRRGQTSITHLLNYAAPSRAYLEHTFGDARGGSGSSFRSYGGPGRSYRSHHHNSAVDKARFVHANYRFIVSPTGHYAAQAVDADEYLDWADVLQVIASAQSQNSSCPICLSEPVAPRMAKCGHIFCLPCLIRFMHASTDDKAPPGGGGGFRAPNSVPGHYVASTNSTAASGVVANGGAAGTGGGGGGTSAPGATKGAGNERKAKWKKCPICEESIYLAEVRPVRFYAAQESPLPRPGDDVVLRLMMRQANSTVALPREGAADVLNAGGSSSDGIPWHFAANVLDYARIMKGTGDYMVEEFSRELDELARQEKEDELLFHEDGEWTQRAMKAVRSAQDKARALGGMEVALADACNTAAENGRPPKLPVGAEPASPSVAAASLALPRTAQTRPNEQHHDDVDYHQQPHRRHHHHHYQQNAPPPPHGGPAQPDFFFYMAPPHLYLSPLDIRILKTKYGAFSAFPSTLLPRVEHISTGHVVDDALRRRAKYLGHLPAGCVVSFLECDWTDIVPADTLATFAGDLDRRRKRNRDKAAQEERERLQAERLEAAALHQQHPRRARGANDVFSGAGSIVLDDSDGGGHGSDGVHGFNRPAVVDMNDFRPLGSHDHDRDDDDDGQHETDGSSSVTTASPPKPRTGFAHLAAAVPAGGSSPAHESPSLLASPSSSLAGSGGRTVWGTRAVPTDPHEPPSQQQQVRPLSGGLGVDDDGWLKDEQVLGSLGVGSGGSGTSEADFLAQMAALGVETVAAEDVDNNNNGGGGGGAKKKKKKQKITLMSTGGRRGN